MIADAFPLWLRAVEGVLDDLGVTTVGATTIPAEAAEMIETYEPEILITDLDFGSNEPDGAAFVKRALEIQPDLRVIVLTRIEDSSTVAEAIAAGASVYIVKTVSPDDLAAAVRQMFEHSVYFAPRQLPNLSSRSAGAGRHDAPTSVVRRLDLPNDSATTLTKREAEILDLVSEGLPNAEIGRRLWITEQTVKFHLSNIYRKLGVSNRTQASRWTNRIQRNDPAHSA